MKLVALCGKRGEGKFALVDDADFERVSQYKWYYDVRVKKRKDGSVPDYCHFRIRARLNKTDKSPVSLHRFILGIYDPTVDIDHINENPLDNRTVNLRAMDHVEHAKKSVAKKNKNLAERKLQCINSQVSSTQQTDV